MAAQLPLVMGLLLICVVIAIYPWKMISERWNKVPVYALGMGIGGLAVAARFPPSPPTDAVDLRHRGPGGFWLCGQLGVSLVNGALCGGRRPAGNRRTAQRRVLWRWGLGTRASEALAISSTGWVLALFHYTPNVAQTSQTLLGIRLFFR